VSRAILAIAVALLAIGACRAAADDSSSPHRSTEMCAVCHKEDMTLQRSKLDTCTLCHGGTPHSGAAEHLRLEAARVKQALGGKADEGGVMLPLTDDGRIWCGTCHLFHDPSLGEAWLSLGWIPPDTGLPKAVRDGVTTRWDALAAAHGQSTVDASFAAKGTRQLRLPVEDGTLCTRCHGSIP
jgi:hypothetical protein